MSSMSNSSSTSSTSNVTQHLRETLAQSRAVLEDWIDQERQAAKVQAAEAARLVSLKQNEIDSASAELLALQLESGLSMLNNTSNNSENDAPQENLNNASAKRKEFEIKVKNQQTQNSELETRLQEQQKKLAELSVTHKHQKERALSAQQQSASVVASKSTRIDNLTRGILNYKHLAIDFEKGENETLRFSFTQIDPIHPEQKFSFSLAAIDDEEYFSVVECEPPVLAPETLEELITPLNNTDDVSSFVRGMRQAFLQHVTGQ